jgi:hypothetical protein
MKKKKLPIGVQDFRILREENSVYIDKTQYVFRIIEEANYYFLSRPRRFGKSLLLSTFKELFEGSKELFEGLWIEDKWDWSKQNPVVHISFAAAGLRVVSLEQSIQTILDNCANEHGITLTKQGFNFRFRELLEKLHHKKGRVVVLIDEYDKAIVDYLDNIPKANEHRELLRDFFGVLKDTPQYLRFVFITGISKFSKVSIFSALNHLNDISLDDNYASLLGYTQEDLENHFNPYLIDAAKKNELSQEELLSRIKYWYNGYSWDGKNTLYNPFSILNFFKSYQFSNYWFSTGTPTFLSVLARQQQFFDLEEVETSLIAFETFDIENLDPQAVMFQTGYLTIKKYDDEYQTYVLGYPNHEVRKSFLEYMLEAYTFQRVNQVPPTVIKMRRAFDKKDVETVMEMINSMFANIPSHIFDGTSEKYFHSLIHLLLSYLGVLVDSEVNTNKGRLDAVIHTPQYIYILEFKFNKSPDIALEDIKKRGYSDKYRQFNKEIVPIGINFSSAKKAIDAWKVGIHN